MARHGSTGHIQFDGVHLLSERSCPLLLGLGLRPPEHRVGRDRRAEQCNGAADAGEVEAQLRNEGMKEDRTPVGMREERGQDIGDKHKAHRQEDLFKGLEVAIDGEIPEHYCGWNDKPDPPDARHELKPATNRGQIGGNQGDVADNQEKRDTKHNWPPIVFAQEL